MRPIYRLLMLRANDTSAHSVFGPVVMKRDATASEYTEFYREQTKTWTEPSLGTESALEFSELNL